MLSAFLALVAAAFLLIAFGGLSTGMDMTIAILLVILSAGFSYGKAKRRRK